MPFDTTWTARGVEWRLWGAISVDEIDRLNAEFSGDPRSERARYQLVDLREVSELTAPGEDLRSVGAYDHAQSLSTPNIRVAFIVTDARFNSQLQEYSEMLKGSSWEARTFTDPESARGWAEEESSS